MEAKLCPICGADIKVSYVTPEKSFMIEDGNIIRDDAWDGPIHDSPYFEYYCSNDREDCIDSISGFQQWKEEVENEFEQQNLYAA